MTRILVVEDNETIRVKTGLPRDDEGPGIFFSPTTVLGNNGPMYWPQVLQGTGDRRRPAIG